MGYLTGDDIRIFLSAGEASGDLHGARLVRSLQVLAPRADITCLGGAWLRDAGARVLIDNRDLAVVGLLEVGRHLRSIFLALNRIRAHLARNRPDALVLIDFPDFNLLLARFAGSLGIKVFYYIGPQVWAWRAGRVRALKRLVDEMAVILPFEPAFYHRHGMSTHYVGHPLLDILEGAPSREQAVQRYRTGVGPFVGLLPGSRRSEVSLVLPVLLDAAALLKDALPGASFLLPVAPSLAGSELETAPALRGLPIRLVSGDTYGAIRACDLVLATSGTVTLETAILGVPMVIVNRVSPLTYLLGRRLIRVEHVGLPNLIAGRLIVPELLQEAARPELLAAEALDLLEDPGRMERQLRDLAKVRSQLGLPGVADRVARLLLNLIGGGR